MTTQSPDLPTIGRDLLQSIPGAAAAAPALPLDDELARLHTGLGEALQSLRKRRHGLSKESKGDAAIAELEGTVYPAMLKLTEMFGGFVVEADARLAAVEGEVTTITGEDADKLDMLADITLVLVAKVRALGGGVEGEEQKALSDAEAHVAECREIIKEGRLEEEDEGEEDGPESSEG